MTQANEYLYQQHQRIYSNGMMGGPAFVTGQQAKQVDSAFMATFGVCMDGEGVNSDSVQPNPVIKSNLFDYQRKGLAWLVQRESAHQREHLFWELRQTDEGEDFWINVLSGEISDQVLRPSRESWTYLG
jgi:hypothetical protein